ncbi:MAG: hypothetical protein SWO11_16925, partial [Thermodesulfobacteriota bacterium]|nr:hypothetical protein [Thermodesulfobacteriota bacterium]
MKKRIILLSLIFLALFIGVYNRGGHKPAISDPNQKKSILFSEKLDRTTPGTFLKPGSIVDGSNMMRPGPGLPIGWKMRGGSTKYNTTAIAADEVKGIWKYENSEHNIECFFAQCNDKIYISSSNPPNTVATFGTAIYTLDSGTSAAFGEKINDDMVWAAKGNTPWAYSGGTAWPDRCYIKHEAGTTLYDIATEDVNNDRIDQNVLFVQHSGASEQGYIGFRRRLVGASFDFVTGATNIEASGITFQAYRGGVWCGVSNLTDGTADPSGVTTCYKSGGRVTWDYNEEDEAIILPWTVDHYYWYRFGVTGYVTQGIKAYRIRVHDQCEEMTNLWGGKYNIVLSAFKDSSVSGYLDYTAELTSGNKYLYMDIGGLTSSDSVILGFLYQSRGLYLDFDPEYVNGGTTGGVSVYGWNGGLNTWVAKNVTIDSTSQEGAPCASKGTIVWDDDDIDDMRQIGTDFVPLYYYKIVWNFTLPDDIRLIEAGQIPRPDTIPPFPKYAIVKEYHERALWGPSITHPHGLDFSQVDYPHILMQDGVPNITARSAGSTGNIFGPGEPYAIVRFADWGILGTIDPLALYILQGKTQGTIDSMRISSTVG